MSEQQPTEEEYQIIEESVCANILNLTSAFSNLGELDPMLLSKQRQAKLAKMKRQIFDALAFYCACLPEEEEEKED